MPIFKTTEEVFSKEWRDSASFNMTPPATYEWNLDRKIIIEDIERWEQIYYSFGDLGIYSAWRPKSEFYIIVHDFFLDDRQFVKTFFGDTAANEVYSYAKSYGIDLKNQLIWVN
jgi:hypothetical protein